MIGYARCYQRPISSVRPEFIYVTNHVSGGLLYRDKTIGMVSMHLPRADGPSFRNEQAQIIPAVPTQQCPGLELSSSSPIL